MIRRIVLLTVLGALLLLFLVFVLPMLLPRRARSRLIGLFYQDRRPTEFGRKANRAWAWIAAHGLTPETWPVEPRGGTISLETAGRRSGQPRQNVVTWVEHDGERYVVSMLGHHSDWVRNVRTAGGDAAILHRGRRPVRLVEVPAEQRAAILQKYLRLTATSTSDHLGIEPEDPIEEFIRIAPNHPVFRIVPRDS